VSVLDTVRDQHRKKLRAAVPPGIRRAIQRLEANFAARGEALAGLTEHFMAQLRPVLSLAEIAIASGFCDQAHLNLHFRRFFGSTPASFRSRQAHFEVNSCR
jgi:AraC-like DNA-binding protein